MSAEFYGGNSPMASMYPLVGVYRHHNLMCRPGLYAVVFCIDTQWMRDSCVSAVCDDFGNLVKVTQ